MSELPSQITSTLQALARDLATQLKADFALTQDVATLDMDDFLNIGTESTGRQPATVVQFLTCVPTPRDPLYTVAFVIGFKVGDDSAGFRMMKAMDRVFQMTKIGTLIDVKDFMVDGTVDMANAPVTATMTISESTLLDQAPEVIGLVRLYAVTCQCLNLQ